jgi:hypothetical protein
VRAGLDCCGRSHDARWLRHSASPALSGKRGQPDEAGQPTTHCALSGGGGWGRAIRCAHNDRALRISAPGEGSWAAYLDQALRTELATSGNYDAEAPARIEATLSEVHITDGEAEVTGRFVVRQGVSVRYDKVLRADARWDSAFLGVIAISSGLNQSTAIFQALLRKLFADPDFARSAT